MKRNRIGATWLAVLCSVVLVAGVASLVSSPANAKASISWAKIWKKQIKPRADKRYYTKKKSNARYAAKSSLSGYTPVGTAYTKAESDAKYATIASLSSSLANYYTKAQSDANYYSKAQSDARYAPAQALIRGTFSLTDQASVAGQLVSETISFGRTLSAAPAVHYIKVGDAVPAGCSGSASAPDASAGNLCVFEQFNSNSTTRGVYNPGTPTGAFDSATPFGAAAYGYSTAAGGVIVFGTWAVRPAGYATGSNAAGGRHSGPGVVR